MIVERRSDVV